MSAPFVLGDVCAAGAAARCVGLDVCAGDAPRPVLRACATCGAESAHAGDFVELAAAAWVDDRGHHAARVVVVCTCCLAGDTAGLRPASRVVVAGISALLGGSL